MTDAIKPPVVEVVEHDLDAVTPTVADIAEIVSGTTEAVAAMVPSVMQDNASPVVAEVVAAEEIEDPELAEMDEQLAQLHDDFEAARDNIQVLAERGMKAVEEAALVASVSDHHHAYQALATLIKAMTKANESMVELHNTRLKVRRENRLAKKEAKVSTPAAPVSTNNGAPGAVTNNVVFVGTTADLIQKILDEKKKLNNA